MLYWDFWVGFVREPKGLDAFLYRQGYDPISTDDGGETYFHYISRKGLLVNIFFFPKSPPEIKGLEVPDWKGNGYEITSEMKIVTDDGGAIEKTINMTRRTAIKYDGVFYETQIKEFLTRDQL